MMVSFSRPPNGFTWLLVNLGTAILASLSDRDVRCDLGRNGRAGRSHAHCCFHGGECGNPNFNDYREGIGHEGTHALQHLSYFSQGIGRWAC